MCNIKRKIRRRINKVKSLIVEYDLCQPGDNYDNLIQTIKEYSEWAHITKSTWFIKTNDSCVNVRNYLSSKMDGNDRLFVAELTGAAAWSNVICDSDYLKEKL